MKYPCENALYNFSRHQNKIITIKSSLSLFLTRTESLLNLNYQLTDNSQIDQIRSDGSFRLSCVVNTRGDNPGATQEEIYRQIRRIELNYNPGGSDGGSGGEPSDLINQIKKAMTAPKGIRTNVACTLRPRTLNATNNNLYEVGVGCLRI